MPELSFSVEAAHRVEHAASPQLALELVVENRGAEPIHSVLLECQVRIEPARRAYDEHEAERLFELFGERERWSATLQSLLWARNTVLVAAFDTATSVELPLTCSFDLELATTKYFYGLAQGEIPLLILFSGSVFYEAQSGTLQVARIAWTEECRFRLPLEVYRQTIDHYYPDRAPLALQKGLVERLRVYKQKSHAVSYDAALESLLDLAEKQP